VSFFDDDEPRTTRTRPRNPVASGMGPGVDPQQLLVRRLVAAGVGVVVLVVLVLMVKSCVSGHKEQALKDYNSKVSSLVQDVNSNTEQFFTALTTGGTSAIEVQTQINQFRGRAKAQTKQAEGLDVPGDMKPAQRNLLLSLGLVEEAMGKVADKVPGALSNDSATAEPAVISLTAEMEAFLAADVVYKRRAVALIKQVLDDQGIAGQTIQDSHFLPNIGWLDPGTVAKRIHADAARAAGNDASTKPIATGTHGHALVGVSVGATTLQPGTNAANRLTAAAGLVFQVKIANQGENAETDVPVVVTITPIDGGKAITTTKTVDQTQAGTQVVVPVAIAQTPPVGAATIKVQVRKVPGEQTVTNNSQEYPAIFSK
jgi:hypothetical protein